jgi:hypothetical protein
MFYRIPHFELHKLKTIAKQMSKLEATETFIRKRREQLARRALRANDLL